MAAFREDSFAADGARAVNGTDKSTQDDGRASDVSDDQSLTPEEKDVIAQMQARSRQVHQHEAAHQAVGGRYAGAASFSYQIGPNGQRYAVGGEVPIDASAVPGEPRTTIQKMQTVRAAALAPTNPSGQDQQVASAALQTIMQARTKLSEMEQQKSTDNPNQSGNNNDKPAAKLFADAATSYAELGQMPVMAARPERVSARA